MKGRINVFWFRRDLRLDDNMALYHALRSDYPVMPVFIFDPYILDKLDRDDARVSFIHQALATLNEDLNKRGSSLLVLHGSPQDVLSELISSNNVQAVFANHDYEPYARQRDQAVGEMLAERNIPFHTFKDQVIFEKEEVVKADGSPYTVYTPYMKKWMDLFGRQRPAPVSSEKMAGNFTQDLHFPFPELEEIGFRNSVIKVREFDTSHPLISSYRDTRDLPYLEGTSRIGPYLRFGLVGIRTLVRQSLDQSHTYLKELVWREFFMQVLWHFPRVVDQAFKVRYERVGWINDERLFRKWCDGQTGYPIVDAGMRQLRATGYMHNRVRMITASFLCKHLLTDWRWGEAWFAKHLLDYELSSNNGNWQWAAGTGCDAAPYFRVFNPTNQQAKFDPDFLYIKKWVPEYGTPAYATPVADHKTARERAISAYKMALSG
jgi:deoxyribodipyrimidine photo-lyase